MDWLSISIIAARIVIEAVFFLIGISIFSFLNVVIYRLPRHKQFTGGRSMCTSCGHELSSKDLIPVFSWLSLRGKCRYCGSKISVRYTVVELIGGVTAIIGTLVFGINIYALLVFLAMGVMTVIFCILYDKIKHKK
jgi:Type II secretory pathway, prepilin signal peptidase PulO and related peptidases